MSSSDDDVVEIAVHSIRPGDLLRCDLCKKALGYSIFYSHMKHDCAKNPDIDRSTSSAKKEKESVRAKEYAKKPHVKVNRQMTYINTKYAKNRDVLTGKVFDTVPKGHFLYWSIDDVDCLRELPVRYFGYRERTLFYNYIKNAFKNEQKNIDWSGDCFNKAIFKPMMRSMHPDKVKFTVGNPKKNMEMFGVWLTSDEMKNVSNKKLYFILYYEQN